MAPNYINGMSSLNLSFLEGLPIKLMTQSSFNYSLLECVPVILMSFPQLIQHRNILVITHSFSYILN